MTWIQPICAARWNQDWARPGEPDRLVDVATDENGPGELEHCAYCGKPTRCGVYVRIDSSTVPFPRQEP